MILEIIHVNGNMDDVLGGFATHAASYQYRAPYYNSYSKFMKNLKDSIIAAYNAGMNIIYRPNLRDMPADQTHSFFCSKEDYNKRFPELKKAFPFLSGLEQISLTIIPDGINANGIYERKIDEIIKNDGDNSVMVGGKYKEVCVAAEAANIASRNPGVCAYIGESISYSWDCELPERIGAVPFYTIHTIPQTSLISHLQ